MDIIKVPDMHCSACTARITKAFDGAGIKDYEISLEEHTVSVQGGVSQAFEILEDLGFTPEK